PPRSTLFPYTTLFRSVRVDPRRELVADERQRAAGGHAPELAVHAEIRAAGRTAGERVVPGQGVGLRRDGLGRRGEHDAAADDAEDRKSTRLNSSHVKI